MTMCGFSGGSTASAQGRPNGFRPKRDCRAAAYLNKRLQRTPATSAAEAQR